MISVPIDNPNSNYPTSRLVTKGLGLVIGFSCLFLVIILLPPPAEASQANEQEMVSRYEAAMAEGDEVIALKHVLDYSELAYGEDAPVTINLMHRYGYSLYKDGEYREAINVLKQTLERSTGVYGATGGEAFEININLARAYTQRRARWGPRLKYFDRALEILRERGEQESIIYVATLVNIVINLLDSNSLSGEYSPDFGKVLDNEMISDNEVSTASEYRNNFHTPERYLLEAMEIGARLENLDEYISARIAVLYARLKVMETADLASVPGGVEGFISKSTKREYYDQEEERLTVAIDKLAQDPEANRAFLDAANKIRLEIAWLDKDEERLRNMCASGTANSVSDYPPERLYEIMEGGIVFAPDIGVRVTTNIFKPRRSGGWQPRDEKGNPVKKPYFKPVCIDGHLMAALIHAPRVTVEEVRQ